LLQYEGRIGSNINHSSFVQNLSDENSFETRWIHSWLSKYYKQPFWLVRILSLFVGVRANSRVSISTYYLNYSENKLIKHHSSIRAKFKRWELFRNPENSVLVLDVLVYSLKFKGHYLSYSDKKSRWLSTCEAIKHQCRILRMRTSSSKPILRSRTSGLDGPYFLQYITYDAWNSAEELTKVVLL
jgi:hypothetical protein